jgi:hypothetical protein
MIPTGKVNVSSEDRLNKLNRYAKVFHGIEKQFYSFFTTEEKIIYQRNMISMDLNFSYFFSLSAFMIVVCSFIPVLFLLGF